MSEGVSAKDAGVQPNCPCHGVPMYWHRHTRHPKGGYPICAVENRTRAGVVARNAYRSGRVAERFADQLARGERILDCHHHHTGMAVLKARLDDPRPEGMTLSLVNYWGPQTYWGHTSKRTPYRLSPDPRDYIWESRADNNVRDARRRALVFEEVVAKS